MTPTNPTDAQMKLAREYAAHGYPEDTYYHKNCMAGAYDELGHIQSIILAIQATEARAQGLVEAERERCAKIVEDWNEATRDGDTLHIADAIRNSQHGGERER